MAGNLLGSNRLIAKVLVLWLFFCIFANNFEIYNTMITQLNPNVIPDGSITKDKLAFTPGGGAN